MFVYKPMATVKLRECSVTALVSTHSIGYVMTPPPAVPDREVPVQAGAVGRGRGSGARRGAGPRHRPDQQNQPRAQQVRGQPQGRGRVQTHGREDLCLQVSNRYYLFSIHIPISTNIIYLLSRCTCRESTFG